MLLDRRGFGFGRLGFGRLGFGFGFGFGRLGFGRLGFGRLGLGVCHDLCWHVGVGTNQVRRLVG
ncbi:MAG TPA: hypothetical protein PK132_06825, partial [Dermatophilaceae bacterium]|nr:hypothetical protein [Dermatophilaceae bacterium]HQK59836.1 hypothetical protein [Dermatophilaceae bacterium]